MEMLRASQRWARRALVRQICGQQADHSDDRLVRRAAPSRKEMSLMTKWSNDGSLRGGGEPFGGGWRQIDRSTPRTMAARVFVAFMVLASCSNPKAPVAATTATASSPAPTPTAVPRVQSSAPGSVASTVAAAATTAAVASTAPATTSPPPPTRVAYPTLSEVGLVDGLFYPQSVLAASPDQVVVDGPGLSRLTYLIDAPSHRLDATLDNVAPPQVFADGQFWATPPGKPEVIALDGHSLAPTETVAVGGFPMTAAAVTHSAIWVATLVPGVADPMAPDVVAVDRVTGNVSHTALHGQVVSIVPLSESIAIALIGNEDGSVHLARLNLNGLESLSEALDLHSRFLDPRFAIGVVEGSVWFIAGDIVTDFPASIPISGAILSVDLKDFSVATVLATDDFEPTGWAIDRDRKMVWVSGGDPSVLAALPGPDKTGYLAGFDLGSRQRVRTRTYRGLTSTPLIVGSELWVPVIGDGHDGSTGQYANGTLYIYSLTGTSPPDTTPAPASTPPAKPVITPVAGETTEACAAASAAFSTWIAANGGGALELDGVRAHPCEPPWAGYQYGHGTVAEYLLGHLDGTRWQVESLGGGQLSARQAAERRGAPQEFLAQYFGSIPRHWPTTDAFLTELLAAIREGRAGAVDSSVEKALPPSPTSYKWASEGCEVSAKGVARCILQWSDQIGGLGLLKISLDDLGGAYAVNGASSTKTGGG